MIVNVTISVRRMDPYDAKEAAIMIPLPDNLLLQKRNVRLLTEVAKKVLDGFAKVYSEVCK